MIGAALRWIVGLLRSPLGRAVTAEAASELVDALEPGDPPQAWSSATVRHRDAQIASAAHAFPPTLPPSAPPSAPPESNPHQWIADGIRDSRRCACGAAVFVCRGVVPCCRLCVCAASIRDGRSTWARWLRRVSSAPPPSAPEASAGFPELARRGAELGKRGAEAAVDDLLRNSRRCDCGAHVEACRGVPPCCQRCKCAAIVSEDRAWAALKRRPPP